MNELAMNIRAPKLRGEWVELRFMAAAAENDLHVTKPWGDSAHYDFIVEHEGRFLRLQVKSTKYKHKGYYPCAVHGSQGPYADNAFEFLAVYLIPEDLWYIIPAQVFRGQASVALRPGQQNSKYAKYVGAWELLKSELKREPESVSDLPHEECAATCT